MQYEAAGTSCTRIMIPKILLFTIKNVFFSIEIDIDIDNV